MTNFILLKQSFKRIFDVMKIDSEDPEEGWETVVDFTDGGKTKGVPIKEVIKEIRKLQR